MLSHGKRLTGQHGMTVMTRGDHDGRYTRVCEETGNIGRGVFEAKLAPCMEPTDATARGNRLATHAHCLESWQQFVQSVMPSTNDAKNRLLGRGRMQCLSMRQEEHRRLAYG